MDREHTGRLMEGREWGDGLEGQRALKKVLVVTNTGCCMQVKNTEFDL